MKEDEEWFIVANHLVGESAIRKGAKVWIAWIPGSFDSAQCYVVSRGGRTINKYIRLKKLGNFRAGFRAKGLFGWPGYATKEAATLGAKQLSEGVDKYIRKVPQGSERE